MTKGIEKENLKVEEVIKKVEQQAYIAEVDAIDAFNRAEILERLVEEQREYNKRIL